MSADGEQGGAYPQSKAFRDSLSHQQQMFDAQHRCVPCKLCGGHAVISDAGTGNGYYIRCSNSQIFKASEGCLIEQRRLGGWAYNVMDWWNRLHTAADTPDVEGWQSIKTAPRDCMTEIDMWCSSAEVEGEGWNLRGILMIGTPDWVKREDGSDYFPHENGGFLTYWRPVPAPPAAALAKHPTSPEDAA